VLSRRGEFRRPGLPASPPRLTRWIAERPGGGMARGVGQWTQKDLSPNERAASALVRAASAPARAASAPMRATPAPARAMLALAGAVIALARAITAPMRAVAAQARGMSALARAVAALVRAASAQTRAVSAPTRGTSALARATSALTTGTSALATGTSALATGASPPRPYQWPVRAGYGARHFRLDYVPAGRPAGTARYRPPGHCSDPRVVGAFRNATGVEGDPTGVESWSD
jgi:hypothetical protein